MADRFETNSDDIVRKHRYADTEAIGDKWIEARKLAEKHKGTPHHARYEMAADIARLTYDVACVIKLEATNSQMLGNFLAILEGMQHRLGILEGAYAHLMLIANSAKWGGAHE